MKIITLKGTFDRIITGEADLKHATKEFLDGVKLQTVEYSKPASDLIEEEPDFSNLDSEKLQVSAAFYAGLAEHISVVCEVDMPSWTQNEKLNLAEPFFSMYGPRIREILLEETPDYYRKRNVFCGKIFGALNTPVPVVELDDDVNRH